MLFQGWGTNNAVSLTEIAVEGGREVHLLPFSFITNLQDIQLCEMPSELKNKEHVTKTKTNYGFICKPLNDITFEF